MADAGKNKIDPFFSLPASAEWNACIGPQGEEENYVDGYIQAALELTSAVLEKRLHGKRDTLALPILYNARHGVELALKFTIGELRRIGVITLPRPQDHDIATAYKTLAGIRIGDEAVRSLVESLAPFIESLSSIDDDGQMLRYAETRDGRQSLADRPLVNIAIVDASLKELSKILFALKERLFDFGQERLAGTFTAECSRSDLFTIARMLPQRHLWASDAFAAAKLNIKRRFEIDSNGKLSRVLNLIQAHREMGAIIGIGFQLAHITDQHAKLVIREWVKRHPPRVPKSGGQMISVYEWDLEAWTKSDEVAHQVNEAVCKTLSTEEIADLEVIYYLGRNREPTEHYELALKRVLKKHASEKTLLAPVSHLMAKTNFATAFATGVERLGHPNLAKELKAIAQAAE